LSNHEVAGTMLSPSSFDKLRMRVKERFHALESAMAWFRNHYHCTDCGTHWADEWSCGCDDDCPRCGSRHCSPVESEDLTYVIEEEDVHIVIYRSPKSAEHKPNYQVAAIALSYPAAEAYLELTRSAY